MILYVDFRADRCRMAIIGDAARWEEAEGRDVAFQTFSHLLDKEPELRAKLSAVVVETGREGRTMTWSTARSAVAFGNAMAFALDAPVATVSTDGDAQREAVVAAVRVAAADAKHHEWARPVYDGSPNITTPKG